VRGRWLILRRLLRVRHDPVPWIPGPSSSSKLHIRGKHQLTSIFAVIVRRVVEARRLQNLNPHSGSGSHSPGPNLARIPSQSHPHSRGPSSQSHLLMTQQPHTLPPRPESQTPGQAPGQLYPHSVSRTPALTASEKNLPLGGGGDGGGGDVMERYGKEKLGLEGKRKRRFWGSLKCW
jgi:hypothetical protein